MKHVSRVERTSEDGVTAEVYHVGDMEIIYT